MPLAIFGIENTALNLVVTFAVLCLVAIWLALIVFTFTDARRRIADPFLVGCATAASFFPFVGTIVYSILRPPEFLEDIHERETETRAAEVRMRHLEEHSCHKCGFPTESDFIRCPSCRTRLKDECPTCSKPVGISWKVCPYCETTLVAPKRSSRSGSSKSSSRDEKRGSGEESKRSRRSSKETTSSSSSRPSGRSSSSRGKSASGSSSSRPASSDTTGSKRASSDKTRSGGSRPAADQDKTQVAGRRTPRSARRKPATGEGDNGSTKPINSGDTPAPSATPESR